MTLFSAYALPDHHALSGLLSLQHGPGKSSHFHGMRFSEAAE